MFIAFIWGVYFLHYSIPDVNKKKKHLFEVFNMLM